MSLAGDHFTRGVDETVALARALASLLEEGAWVILSGPLGAGKTAFVRGLAAGLEIDPARVHSPTFTLVSEYPGARPMAHVDLYRVEDPREIRELGLEDLRERGIVVAVEWGERLPEPLRAGAWVVAMESVSADERRIAIRPPDPAAAPPRPITRRR
jgi:tRNA threonylcarbamoyladenosine biosynthesis protein TsaE